MELTGEVRLRPFDISDAECVGKWVTKSSYQNFFQSVGMIPTMEECRNYPRWTGNSVMMVVCDGETVGMVSMYRPSYRNGTCEMGILIDREYQGNKLAFKAGVLWIDYLFGLGFRKLIVSVIDEGLLKPLQKQGFVLEGTHEAEVLVNDRYVTEYRLAYFRR